MKTGRAIGAEREPLEKASERIEAHRKIRRQQTLRIVFSTIGIALVASGLFFVGTFFFRERESSPTSVSVVIPYAPTIPVEDQDTGAADKHLTSRMREYIGQLEADLRELGLVPVKAVIPSGAIREVDFYLEGHPGFVKTTIDRGSGVTAEDTDRMLRYLAGQGIDSFEYIDVRIDGKA